MAHWTYFSLSTFRNQQWLSSSCIFLGLCGSHPEKFWFGSSVHILWAGGVCYYLSRNVVFFLVLSSFHGSCCLVEQRSRKKIIKMCLAKRRWKWERKIYLDEFIILNFLFLFLYSMQWEDAGNFQRATIGAKIQRP